MAANDHSKIQRLYEHFPEYPASANFLEEFLGNMTCTVHHARVFECFSGWKLPSRRLPNDLLFLILKGQGMAAVEGRHLRLCGGSCLHVQRGFEHEIRHDPQKPLRVISVHYTALLDFSLPAPEVLGFPNIFHLKGDELARSLLWEVCRQYMLKPPAAQSAMNSVILALLFHLILHHSMDLHPGYPHHFSDLSRLAPAIRRMRKLDLQSVEDYAAQASLSVAQFRRLFRRAMKTSPVSFLKNLRMERAAFLLRGSTKTIEVISAEVGYSEPAHFAKTFKAKMGLSPGAYRRRLDAEFA